MALSPHSAEEVPSMSKKTQELVQLDPATLTVDTNVRLAAGATIELWGVPA